MVEISSKFTPSLSNEYSLKNFRNTEFYLFSSKTSKSFAITGFLYNFLSQCDGYNSIDQILNDKFDFEDIVPEIERLLSKRIIEFGATREMVANSYNGNRVKRLAIHMLAECNLQCKHCYITEFKKEHLIIDEIDAIMSSAAIMNVSDISISGGEPFLLPHYIAAISEKCKSAGMRLENIFTNGTLLSKNQNILLDLKEHFDTMFYVSVDGLQSTYDDFRGVPGSFEQLEIGLKTLERLGLPIIANIFIHSENCDKLIDIYEYLKKYKTLHRIRFDSGFELGNWKDNCKKFGVSLNEEVDAILKFLNHWESDGKLYEIEYGHLFRYLYNKKFSFQDLNYTTNSLCCEYYRDYVFVFPNGDVTPCALTWPNYICGNIRNSSLENIWESSKMRHFKDLKISDLKIEKCNSCEMLKFCGAGCRGNAMLANNGLYGVDPEICNLFESQTYKLFI